MNNFGCQSFPDAGEAGTLIIGFPASPPCRTHFSRSARSFRKLVAS
jgi:hypothetical protein